MFLAQAHSLFSVVLTSSLYPGVLGFFVKSSAFLARLCSGFVLQLVRFSVCSGMNSIQLS